MRLILIRHAEPDYKCDCLTEKGKREAELLAKRTANWQVDDVYVSPLGRARLTAQPSLDSWKKSATVLEWAREFYIPIDDGQGGKRIPWDFYPSEWTEEEKNFCENEWINAPRMAPLRERYLQVCSLLDEFLKGYGYERNKRVYRVLSHSDKTVVIFCHFGISMIFLSHLLNISAQALMHGICLLPSSVTVLNTEERIGDEAYFRAERIGDCYHLIAGGEPLSRYAYFTEPMQEL